VKDKVKVGILGAGSWGTALAVLLNSNGHEITLWEFDKKRCEKLTSEREDNNFLPGVKLPDSIKIISDLQTAVENKDFILFVVPSHIVRRVAENVDKFMLGDAIIISCSKGIENKTLIRLSKVLEENLSQAATQKIAVLSGPSHAEEVGRKIPTAVVIASESRETAEKAQAIFMNEVFRVYTSTDVAGVELGGALKNVIAIAAGISDGVGYGDNTKAALMNRGMVELTRLGTAMGADPMTFAGLSGMGDLIVTCTSRHSRNRYLGEEIGKGKTLDQVLEKMVMVAEGVKTTLSVHDLSIKKGIEMPISGQVYRVLFEGKDPRDAVRDLMTRDPKAEKWG